MMKLQGFLQKRMSGWSLLPNPSELCTCSCWGYDDESGPLRKVFRNVTQLYLTNRAFWQVSWHKRMGGEWIWPMQKTFGLKTGVNNSNTESIWVIENSLSSKPYNQLTWHYCLSNKWPASSDSPAGVQSSDAPKTDPRSSSQEIWPIWKCQKTLGLSWFHTELFPARGGRSLWFCFAVFMY